MNVKRLFAAASLSALMLTSAEAQEYYDLTDCYLQNADFSASVDYGTDATGNVKNGTVSEPQGWTKDPASKNLLCVTATFSYGTAATFVNTAIPSTGPDGSASGSCFTLCASYKNQMTFYQPVKMAAGDYRLLVTYYNCNANAETVAANLCGWYVSDEENTLSQRLTFGTREWRTDTIDFTLSDVTDGHIQIGIKCEGKTDANAMLAIDNVRLLRTTPYGPQDDLVPAPEVVTDPRFARGATMAFGRIKRVSGEGITERGFCWGENPEPTVYDNSTTDYLSSGGSIYWMQDLKPATIYYMRAYAKNSYGKVGYGDVIKFCTVPKGNVTYWYNNGGDEAANNRVNAAAQEACDIFNNLTEIVKHFSIGYSAGTPTADCYYADEPWMNMGANSSYQRTGTIMHEMQHGLGLVPYSTQWNKNILRSALNGDGNGTGLWLGDRVTEFLRFWDNNSTSQLNGDYQHMWPYGINGANEDNGTKELYFANAMIGQALGEDGLEHRSDRFAEPCYIFTHDDGTKYYLKSEDEERGLYTAYLVPTNSGTLSWRTMTSAEAQVNDSAAWYLSFTPANQYYQLRNAATGQYITYSSGFKTAAHATPTNADNLHLMRGRVDVGSGESVQRGYWIIHPTNNLSPNAMQANAEGAVGQATFDLRNTATKQRWLILTAAQTEQFEQEAVTAIKADVAAAVESIRKLSLVPHRELTAGTDEAYATAIADIEKRLEEATGLKDVMTLQEEADEAAFTFLCNVSATDREQPFDLTYMIENPGMDSTDGWTGSPTLNYSCAEFYQTTFNFYQTLQHLPGGDYQLLAQGFQRPGRSADSYADYIAGTNNVNAQLYAGAATNATALQHIAADAQKKKVGAGEEATVGSTYYVPNNMQAAAAYFAKGLYENSVDATVDKDGSTLRIGIRSTSQPSYYWTIFDNFRLHFFGKPVVGVKGDVNGDGAVDVADIASIVSCMAGDDSTGNAAADVNGDGSVDVADIAAVVTVMAE